MLNLIQHNRIIIFEILNNYFIQTVQLNCIQLQFWNNVDFIELNFISFHPSER